MDAGKEKPMKRIKAISWRVRLGCIILIGIFLLMVLVGLIQIWSESGYCVIVDDGIGFFTVEGGGYGFDSVPLVNFSVGEKLLLCLGWIMALGIQVKIFYHFFKLFYFYAKEKIFSKKANSQLRKVGLTGCLLVIASPIAPQLMHNACYLASDRPIKILFPELSELIFSMSFVLIFSVTVICISWVMERGREMRENQELTI